MLGFIIAGALVAPLFADVEFRGPDFSKSGVLLFAARTGLPGGGSYDALFASDPGSGDIRSLTFYPETVSLVDSGQRLEIRNRFGLFRTDAELRNPTVVPGFPAFERGSPIVLGELPPSETSPDGIWVLETEAVSAAYARLVLFDSRSGARTTAIESVEYSVDRLPARWSPDSRYFVYSKSGSLYYYSLEQLISGRILDESFRRIGLGRIESLRWAADGSLWYLRGTALYRILQAEFFTQALYQGIAGMGTLAGKIPFPFDPNFDDYWVARDGKRIIFSKGGRSLFLVYLDPDDFGMKAQVNAIPHLFLQGGTRVRSVLWPTGGDVTVFTYTIRGKSSIAGAYRFPAPADPTVLNLAPPVTELDAGNAIEIRLSPDESKVVVVGASTVTVRAYSTWKQLAILDAPDSLHALWRDDSRLVVAGRDLIEVWDTVTGKRTPVALSRAEDFGWTEDGTMVASVGTAGYRRQAPALGRAAAASKILPGAVAPSPTAWEMVATPGHLEVTPTSTEWRVYLDALSSGPYRNNVMIRAIRNLGTRPLFPVPKATWAPFPDRNQSLDSPVFDHGSRIRRREVALTFDLMDGTEGLVSTLAVLADGGIKSTFFVNGEFMRREPGASRLLADSGHEVGSMFFAIVDPTDARLAADREYLRRGLARAEDDWFQASNRELSLLWHTPWYANGGEIVAAGASMNYTFIGRDIDPLDWIGRVEAVRIPGSYRSSHRIIEDIMAKVLPGSIIPIRLGAPEGGRDDYLFNDLALLIDNLRGAGYSIVPVSSLIEHAE
jgi:peptidoglycan/xylan/chitin deacetylase (PgdA/CDA1 family)